MKTKTHNSRRFSICLWTLISLATILPLNGHSAELLKNGSFEDPSPYTIPPSHDGRAETLKTAGWQSYAGATRSDKKARTGDWAARFEVTEEDADRGEVNFHMTALVVEKQLVSGETLKASCWILNEGMSFPQGAGINLSFTIESLCPDGSPKWANVPLPLPSDGWQKVEAENYDS